MAKAIPLQLDGRDFAKKGDALLHVRARLQSYSPGQRVADEDEALLRALLARHPDSVAKTGSGVDHFMVRSADYGTKCFWVVRTDGSTERFSYKECL
jgi:hypothetical protein